MGARSSLAKVEAATQRPKNARSLGDASSGNRSRHGNGTLGPLSRRRYTGFHLGRSSAEAKTCMTRLWGRGSMKLALPYKEGYDIVPAWKLSLRSQRILSMEALLLPPLGRFRAARQVPAPPPVSSLVMVIIRTADSVAAGVAACRLMSSRYIYLEMA